MIRVESKGSIWVVARKDGRDLPVPPGTLCIEYEDGRWALALAWLAPAR